MEHNLKATVRYDGAGFRGWQVQPGMRTVQGELERALSRIARRHVRIIGAGRTDAGVHALAQVFSFTWPVPPAPGALRNSLSRMLGPEIRVERIEPVPRDFHARRSAVAKRYAYALLLARDPDPFCARYAWSIPWDIDPDRLAQLGSRLTGEHDFAGFQCAGASVKTTVRTLYSLDIHRGGLVGACDTEGLWRIEFRANGFLYKMARNITGVLVDVARGQLPEARLGELLASPGPFRGHTAPPHGLFLVEVVY